MILVQSQSFQRRFSVRRVISELKDVGFQKYLSYSLSFECLGKVLFVFNPILDIRQRIVDRQIYLNVGIVVDKLYFTLSHQLVYMNNNNIELPSQIAYLQSKNIMNSIRKLVGGPKVRTIQNGYDLDLTYVTDRVIAMAFPASGLQKIYRNSIEDVVSFITEKHMNNYMIFNLSGRKYDYNKFQGKVKEYDWEDHQAPALYTIFEICQQMRNYLEQNNQNVAIVHCNHGKGRTGTIIVSFLIFCNFFENADEALKFYAKRRFNQQGYGVTQPCQIRYVKYFAELLAHKKIDIVPYTLKTIQFVGHYDLADIYVKAKNVRSRETVFKSKCMSKGLLKLDERHLLMGDIFLEVIEKGIFGDNKLMRINFNTIFIKESIIRLKASQISPDSLLKKNKGKIEQDFELILSFSRYCTCNMKGNQQTDCLCQQILSQEHIYWEKIYLILSQYKAPSKQKSVQILYGKQNYLE